MLPAQLLNSACIQLQLDLTDKHAILEHMIRNLVQEHALDEALVLKAVMEREAKRSTGIGLGIAIPHGRIAELSSPVLGIATLQTPIEYGALDHQPVNVIALLVSPEVNNQLHIQALAGVSRVLAVEANRTQLIACDQPEAVLKLFQ